MTIADTTLLDNVSDLSRLSKRQLLERLVRTLERIETNMSADSDYMAAALGDLDTAMAGLSARLDTQAQTLASEASSATDLASLQAVVHSAADKISADAVAIGQMAPSAAADPGTPVTVPTVPADPSQPIDTSGSSSTAADAGSATDASSAAADSSSTAADSSSAAVDGGAGGPLPPSSDTTGSDPSAAADPAAADASGAVSASGDPLPTE